MNNKEAALRNFIMPKERTTILTPLVINTIFSLTFFIYEDFLIRMLYGYFILACFVVWYFAGHLETITFSKDKMTALILAAVISVFSLMPNARIEQGVIYLMLSVDVAMIFVVLADPGENDVKMAFTLFKAAAVLVSVYTIAVFLVPDIYYSGTRYIISAKSASRADLLLRDGYGIVIGGNIVLGDYISFIGFVISLSSILTGLAKKREVWKEAAVCAVCLVSILAVNRKSELLMTLVVAVILFTQKISFRNARARKKARVILLGVAAAFALFIGVLAAQGRLSRYVFFVTRLFTNIAGETDLDVSSGRLDYWKIAIDMFKARPVLGEGWGRCADHMTDAYNVYLDHQMNNVHNNYLQLLAETGIVGFVLVLTPMIILLVRTYKKARRLRIAGMTASVAGVAVLTSLAFQTYGFLLSFIDPIWFKQIFWSLLASLLMMGNIKTGSSSGAETA